MVGHVSPEAAAGGPIARLREGDIISIDVAARALDAEGVDLAARPLATRDPYLLTGALAHYARLVSSASVGAVLAGLAEGDHHQADGDDHQAGSDDHQAGAR
jgi:dihydroxy-acid dehydratase